MITQEYLEKLEKEYQKDSRNKIKRKIVNKVPLIDLVTDETTTKNAEFSINIKTHGITDQKATGRCWAFAALNILREKVIEKCNLSSFELSGSFIAYYDKIERLNTIFDNIIKLVDEGKDDYDRMLSQILSGLSDGGNFVYFANLVNKYGVIPMSVYPDSYAASNTYEVNQILNRIIRKFYLEYIKVKDKTLKEKYLEYVYNVVSTIYGIPPKTFDFEYTDSKGKYHIDSNLTPLEFYKKYINIDLQNDYVELSSYQDKLYSYNHVYSFEELLKISESPSSSCLNLKYDAMYKAALKQIKAKEPVYFYSSTTAKRIDGVWVDTMKSYGDLFDIDLTLDNNDILKSIGVTGCHAMIITGVNLVNGKPTKWKIENSWGGTLGNQGYWIATDDWLRKYVFKVVINKKYLTETELSYLEKEPIKIDYYDTKF